MSLVSYLVIALALGIGNMLLFRRCGEPTPVRLSSGLLIVLVTAAIHTLLFSLGNMLGSLLHLYSPNSPSMYADVNAYIFLGITLAIIIKMLSPYLRKEPRLPLFDLRNTASVLAMGAATGINVLLLGIGTGFAAPDTSLHKLIWPLLAATTLFGYFGLMFGRQKVSLRPLRWTIIEGVLLLGVAIAAIVNAG